MDYEIVKLESKSVAGLKVRTSNHDENMQTAIGGLWQKFYNGVYQSIPEKVNQNSIGLYTNYESDVNGSYDVMVCCETSCENIDIRDVETMVIQSGKYAKFIVHGNVQKAVEKFWLEFWNMKIDRKYSCDFEEYIAGTDLDNAEIHIYISLND